jgi:hypothetical protein
VVITTPIDLDNELRKHSICPLIHGMSVSLMLFWTAPYCQAWQNLSVINFTDATYQ